MCCKFKMRKEARCTSNPYYLFVHTFFKLEHGCMQQNTPCASWYNHPYFVQMAAARAARLEQAWCPVTSGRGGYIADMIPCMHTFLKSGNISDWLFNGYIFALVSVVSVIPEGTPSECWFRWNWCLLNCYVRSQKLCLPSDVVMHMLEWNM